MIRNNSRRFPSKDKAMEVDPVKPTINCLTRRISELPSTIGDTLLRSKI